MLIFQFIVNSSALEIDFSESKDSLAFVDSNENLEILIEEARYEQEEFNKNLKNQELVINL